MAFINIFQSTELTKRSICNVFNPICLFTVFCWL